MAFNYTELESVTRSYFYPKLVDQIFSKDPILDKLRQKKKTVDGGRQFSVNIKVDTLNHGGFGANTTFDVTKKEIINRVDLPVRGMYSNLTIDGFEEVQNKGKQAILNLLSEKMSDLEEAMRQELISTLYDDPATADPSNLKFQGLVPIIDNNNTYAGLDRTNAANDFWRAEVIEDTTGSAPVVLDYDKLREFFMNATDAGKDGRDIVFVGDFGTIAKIEDILATRNQIRSIDTATANLGFESYTLFNKPVYASSQLEAKAKATGQGVLYILNFDYLTMHTLAGYDFKMTGFKQDRNSELKSQQLIVAGNYVATKPKRLGRISNISLA